MSVWISQAVIILSLVAAMHGAAIPDGHVSWAVHIRGGILHAQRVVNETGARFIAPIGTLPDLYHVSQVSTSMFTVSLFLGAFKMV
jgi:hypothetical protein